MELFLEEHIREVKKEKEQQRSILDPALEGIIAQIVSNETASWLKQLFNTPSYYIDKQDELINPYKESEEDDDPALEVFPKKVQDQLLELDTKLLVLRSLMTIEVNLFKMLKSIGPETVRQFLGLNPKMTFTGQLLNYIEEVDLSEKPEERDEVGDNERVVTTIEDEKFKKCIIC